MSTTLVQSGHTALSTDAANVETRRVARTSLLLLALVLICGVGLRLLGIRNGWLWLDELLSANYAYNSFLDVIITVLRFDVHSPLYYLQLSAWLLLGTSDAWMMMNSVAWSVAATLSIYWVGRRVAGDNVGLTAAALFAVVPGAVLYGYELRMYVVIMTAIIWAWYFNHVFATEGASRTRTFALALSELAVIYSHGAGAVMVLGVCAYGVAVLAARRDGVNAKRWMLVQACVGLTAVPALTIVAIRQANHPGRPDLDDIVGTMVFLFFGPAPDGFWAYGLAAVLMAVLVVAAVHDSLARNLLLWTIMAPIAAIAFISIVGPPVWLARTMSFVIPLLCLAVATALWRIPFGRGSFVKMTRIAVVGLIIVLLGATSVWTIVGQRKGDGFRPVAEALRTQTAPGDVVFVATSAYEFWCLAWYFAGPGWGGPLTIHDTPARWQQFYDRLGPYLSQRLKLDNSRSEMMVNGVRLVAGAVASAPDVDSKRLWHVTTREKGTYQVVFAGRLRADAPDFGQLILAR